MQQIETVKRIHKRDLGMAAANDALILARAAADDRIVASADTDFGTLLALRDERRPSFLLFRGATPKGPGNQENLLIASLPAVTKELKAVAIVVIEPTRLKVRPLLIPGEPQSKRRGTESSPTPRSLTGAAGLCRSRLCPAMRILRDGG